MISKMTKSLKLMLIGLLIAILMVIVLYITTENVKGDAELPFLHVGDKWEYNISGQGISGTGEIEVNDIGIITVNSKDYNVYVLNSNSNVVSSGGSYTLTGTMYYQISNLARVKGIFDSDSSHQETTYNPPADNYQFPIIVGENWNFTTIATTTSDSGNYTNTITFYYYCSETENTNVIAGTYFTYVIAYIRSGSSYYYIHYYSPSVKFFIKEEAYDNYGSKLSEINLTSFSEGVKKVVLYEKNVSNDSVELVWSKSEETNFVKYEIYQAKNQDFSDGVLIATITDKTTTSYFVSNLEESQGYYFKIKVYASGNESNIIKITTLNTIPNSVYLSYNSLTTSSINLTWTKNNDNDFYSYIIMKSENNLTWNFVSEITNQSTTSYEINSLSENTKYYFKIRVYDLGDLYNDSNIISITTLNGIPNSVFLSYGNLTSSSLNLTWTKNNNSDFYNYSVMKSENNLTWQTIATITSQNTTFYNINSLSENTKYYFKIRVYDLGNLYNDSNIINITTLNEIPNNVSLSYLIINSTTVKLIWTKNNNSDFESYKIYNMWLSFFGMLIYEIYDINTTEYIVDLSNSSIITLDGSYKFFVRVYDLGNLYNDSNIISINISEQSQNQEPIAVSLSISEKTSSSITLSWSKNTSPNFLNYTIYKSTDNQTWIFLTSISNQNTTSYIVSNLNQNTTYYFKIRVYNSLGLFNDTITSAKTTSETTQQPTTSQPKNEFPILYIILAVIIIIVVAILLSFFFIRNKKLKSQQPQYPYMQSQYPYQIPQQQYPYQPPQYSQQKIVYCPNCSMQIQVFPMQKEVQCPRCGIKGNI